ncbi:MAG: ABC transporter ATP-binding protein [Eubacterium sp.]|nr:ABC transporter ATP-binding protein [Eubacterium sp.]MBR1675511.1 ABC transporter ATP-binding protein [Eubacterium sp.]
MESIITGKNIYKYFFKGQPQEFAALKGVNIEIPKGALTIIKGRSGSGKTTLLNMLSALDNPDEGEIVLGGDTITSMTDSERDMVRRKKIGFVFQSVALLPVMSAYENIDFGLRIAGVKKDRDARIMEVLGLVGLAERAKHMPTELSGGEKQRIAIARAIAAKPLIIFADEPTGALDTATGIRIVTLFKNIIEKEGITIVMTTHDPGLMQMGDVTYEMSDGVIS